MPHIGNSAYPYPNFPLSDCQTDARIFFNQLYKVRRVITFVATADYIQAYQGDRRSPNRLANPVIIETRCPWRPWTKKKKEKKLDARVREDVLLGAPVKSRPTRSGKNAFWSMISSSRSPSKIGMTLSLLLLPRLTDAKSRASPKPLIDTSTT